MTDKNTGFGNPAFQQMVEGCAQLAAVDREIKNLQAKKRKLVEALIKPLNVMSNGEFLLSNGTKVVSCTGTERTATKSLIVEKWGEEGAKFWASIEPKTRDYISIIQVKK